MVCPTIRPKNGLFVLKINYICTYISDTLYKQSNEFTIKYKQCDKICQIYNNK